MEFFLERITQQAMNYAIRSGITITATYAFQQSTRLLKTVEGDGKDELKSLQDRLQDKIKIISPAIDMIELISARGNTSLESAVSLARSLRQDIEDLGKRISRIANDELEGASQPGSGEQSLKEIVTLLKALLSRIENAVPYINLAITTSGANLSTRLPASVSPSRLLQASTFLTAGDTMYATRRNERIQVGPTFTLSLYMLFAGHVRPENEEQVRKTTWKEAIHKTRVKLFRVPLKRIYDLPGEEEQDSSVYRADEYAYQMLMIEDLDDDRVHTFEDGDEQPGPFNGVLSAGIREVLPVHEISKIFYADTGKILNIGSEEESNNPILLIKRDPNAIPPRRMSGEEAEEHEPVTKKSKWRLPPNLDPEWLAFEVYTEAPDSDSDSETPASPPQRESPGLVDGLEGLSIHDSTPANQETQSQLVSSTSSRPIFTPQVRTSLSLLETLIRLISLQQFQQMSHLSIPDEFLNFFLSESASSGIRAGDEAARARMVSQVTRTVGFNPYEESPQRSDWEPDFRQKDFSPQTPKSSATQNPTTPESSLRKSARLAKRASAGNNSPLAKT